MPRTKKTAAAPAVAEYSPDEQALREKYPLLNLIPGSLQGTDNATFPGKRVVTLACPKEGCGRHRTIPTSDAFHVIFCRACTDEHAKERARSHRRERRESDRAMAALQAGKAQGKAKTGRRKGTRTAKAGAN